MPFTCSPLPALKVSLRVSELARFSLPALPLLGPAWIVVPAITALPLMICVVSDAGVSTSTSLMAFTLALVNAPYATVVEPSIHLYVIAVLPLVVCCHLAQQCAPVPTVNVPAGSV